MSVTKAITLRLPSSEYDRLEAEATRLGMQPATLARAYVQVGLNGSDTLVQRNRRAGLEALDRLMELTSDLPPVDAVQFAVESREELEQRGFC